MRHRAIKLCLTKCCFWKISEIPGCYFHICSDKANWLHIYVLKISNSEGQKTIFSWLLITYITTCALRYDYQFISKTWQSVSSPYEAWHNGEYISSRLVTVTRLRSVCLLYYQHLAINIKTCANFIVKFLSVLMLLRKVLNEPMALWQI
jgi:hypothetical protein